MPRSGEDRDLGTSHDRVGAGADPTFTTFELRLLPLLATHLHFLEIGQRLYVSNPTVKTQAISKSA